MCVIWVIKEFADCSSFSTNTRANRARTADTTWPGSHIVTDVELSLGGPTRQDRAARRSTLTHAWCPDTVSPFRGRRLHIGSPARCTAGESSGQEDCRCGRPCAGSQAKMAAGEPGVGGTLPPPPGPRPGPRHSPLGRARHLPPLPRGRPWPPVASASRGRAVHCPPGSPRGLALEGKPRRGSGTSQASLFPEAEPLGWNAPAAPSLQRPGKAALTLGP